MKQKQFYFRFWQRGFTVIFDTKLCWYQPSFPPIQSEATSGLQFMYVDIKNFIFSVSYV